MILNLADTGVNDKSSDTQSSENSSSRIPKLREGFIKREKKEPEPMNIADQVGAIC